MVIAIIEYAGTRLAIIIQSSDPIFVLLVFRTINRRITASVSMMPSTKAQCTAAFPRGLGDMIREATVALNVASCLRLF